MKTIRNDVYETAKRIFATDMVILNQDELTQTAVNERMSEITLSNTQSLVVFHRWLTESKAYRIAREMGYESHMIETQEI